METPQRRISAAFVALLAVLSAAAACANPEMTPDYEHMMGWLAHSVVQGLSFNAGSTFDPPNELKPWHMQPDLSFGVGTMPLDKAEFPALETPALAAMHPENLLPNSVTFPNAALHVRLGLPGRFDVTFRGADMTIPKGYRLAPGTEGDGQSNSMGVGLRRHFFGYGGKPLLSLSANYNRVKGYFNFVNGWQRLDLGEGLRMDTRNVGRAEWNVNSVGVNAILSRTFGIWTPFAGVGWNHISGSMMARLETDFLSFQPPVVGEASAKPEENQGRLIVGTQVDRSRFSFFVNGEVKAIGIQSGRAFIVQTGVVAPFRIGSNAFASKGTRDLAPKDELAEDAFAMQERERLEMRDAPADIPAPKRRAARARRQDDLPEMIFLQ